ncbi:hypothetical protein EE612_024773 [Oryza sativa]|nr:hypothetical protein EE612_024773 [Oryza sativa]KAF2935218.1 hypothetical protein DAI22_04g216400 [Oryza sativa Japonica Group]
MEFHRHAGGAKGCCRLRDGGRRRQTQAAASARPRIGVSRRRQLARVHASVCAPRRVAGGQSAPPPAAFSSWRVSSFLDPPSPHLHITVRFLILIE